MRLLLVVWLLMESPTFSHVRLFTEGHFLVEIRPLLDSIRWLFSRNLTIKLRSLECQMVQLTMPLLSSSSWSVSVGTMERCVAVEEGRGERGRVASQRVLTEMV